MILIEINPEAIIQYYDTERILVVRNNRQLDIKGPLMSKVFIKHWKEYISPIEIKELYEKIAPKENINDKEFAAVVDMLVDKNILLARFVNEMINRKYSVVIFDYTNQSMGEEIKWQFEQDKHRKNNSVMVDCVVDHNGDNVTCMANCDVQIAVLLLWQYDSGILDMICSRFDENTIVLPVVCNYSYLSIGPQITDMKTRECGEYGLEREKKRYTYINYSPSRYYIEIMASLLHQEILSILEGFDNEDVPCKSRGEIFTYNMSSDSINYRTYLNIQTESTYLG